MSSVDDLLNKPGRARLHALRDGLKEALGVDPFADIRLPAADPNKPHVVVVGAGFAGLTAAYILRLLKFDVTVLEGNNRVGGRVWSKPTFEPGFLVEHGAELIGTNFAVWLAFAEAFGLRIAELFTAADVDAEVGEGEPGAALADSEALLIRMGPQDAGRDRDRSHAINEGIEELERRLAALAAAVQPYQPWKEAAGVAADAAIHPTKLDAKTLEEWTDAQLVDREHDIDIRAAFKAKYANDNVSEPANQSLLGVLGQIAGGGLARFGPDTETSRCCAGNDALAKSLHHRLGKSVRLGACVTRIDAVDAKDPNARFAVYVDGDAEPVEADFVIVAVPPPLFGSGYAAQPSTGVLGLPGDIDPVSVSLSGGQAVKFFALLDQPFWDRLSAEELRAESLNVEAGVTWQSRRRRLRHDAVLALFAGGDAAKRALDRDSAVKRDEFYRDQIGSLGLFDWYDPQETDFEGWSFSRPWAGWAYASASKNQTAGTDSIARNLAEPKGRVVFAGEHTCPAFIGYMEGALESGFLVVDLIRETPVADGSRPRAIRSVFEAACHLGSELAAGKYVIRNVDTGQYLSFQQLIARGDITEAIDPCEWWLAAADARGGGPRWLIPAKAVGLRCDVREAKTAPGSEVWLYSANRTAAQEWFVDPVTGGWTITNPHANLVLQPGADHKVTLQRRDEAAASQAWQFVPTYDQPSLPDLRRAELSTSSSTSDQE